MHFSVPSGDRVLVQDNGTHAVPIKPSYECIAKNCKMNVTDLEWDEIEFQVIGWPNYVINSIRRSVHAEVPTLTIDKIEIGNNSSIIFDELLSQRVGLVPIQVDPRKFEYRLHISDPLTEKNCITFDMNVKCHAGTDLMTVYSKDLKWVPFGKQEFEEGDVPKPVPDIEIAKLIPGQEIQLKAFCLKGCGRDHAKFSPAANVSFKPMSVIEFTAPIQGEAAHKLKSLFKSAIEIKNVKGIDTASVKNPLPCLNYWKVLEDEQLKNLVKISYDKNSFIFTAEGVGCMPAKVMVEEGIKIIRDIYKLLLDALNDIM